MGSEHADVENVSRITAFAPLNGVTLNARDGECGAAGRQRAGKSSIFHGQRPNRATGGSIRFHTRSWWGCAVADRATRRGPVPKPQAVFADVGAAEPQLGAYVHRGDKAGNCAGSMTCSTCSRFWGAARTGAGSLSGGQQQMVAIGRAMMGRPRLCCSTSFAGLASWWSSRCSR